MKNILYSALSVALMCTLSGCDFCCTKWCKKNEDHQAQASQQAVPGKKEVKSTSEQLEELLQQSEGTKLDELESDD